MQYQFPIKSRDKRKKDSILQLEKMIQVKREIRDRLYKKCVDEVPLFQKLLEINLDEEPYREISFKSWRAIYMKHGWTPKIKVNLNELFQKRSLLDFDQEENYDPKKTYCEKDDRKAYFQEDLSHIGNWVLWRSDGPMQRILKLFQDARFDLSLLDRQKTIYTHEAFLISLGISPHNIDFGKFAPWFFDDLSKYEEQPESKGRGLKGSYYDYDEWKTIQRRFKTKKRKLRTHEYRAMSEAERHESSKHIEIDKHDFIQWAMEQGYIEEANKEYQRNESKAPFEREFSELLYKELKDKQLISGEFSEKWQWQTKSNSLNYFIRLLWINTLPREWYARHPNQSNGPEWDLEEGVMHYFFYKEQTKIRLQRPKAQAQVDKEVEIENVVNTLLTQVNDPHGMKYL